MTKKKTANKNKNDKQETSNESVVFTIGRGGCTMIIDEGFTYVKNRTTGPRTYWSCSKRVRINIFLFFFIIGYVKKNGVLHPELSLSMLLV